MSIRGPLTHIDLSVSDPGSSIPFYEALFGALGYLRMEVDHPDFQGDSPSRRAWQVSMGGGAGFAIEVRPASGPNRGRRHDRYAPGMHHMAFHAGSAADVERVHETMSAAGAAVLDPPTDYTGRRGYSCGYYAVFFADPDGIKVEVAYIPASNP